MRDVELKYDPIEKHAYSLIKSLKTFRIYILHAKVLAYVPSAVVKDVLTQPDIDGKRAKLIAKLIEFDIEVKPTKLVKGQGLAKLMAKENCEILGMNFTCVNSANLQTKIAVNLYSCEWYSVIIHFLKNLEVPPGISMTQAQALKLKSVKFCIVKNLLYWKDPSGILLRCLDKEESVQVMHQFHSSTCGFHHY